MSLRRHRLLEYYLSPGACYLVNFRVENTVASENNNLKAFIAVIPKHAEDDHWRNLFLLHFLVSFTLRFLEIKKCTGKQAGEAGHKEKKSIIIVRQSLSYHKVYFQDLKRRSILKHFGSHCSDA